MGVLESRCQVQSRPYFSCMPQRQSAKCLVRRENGEDAIYEKKIKCERPPTWKLQWMSRATVSYITIKAHYLNDHWEIQNPVLQTCPIYEAHTGEILEETDNARNIVNATKEAGSSTQMGVFFPYNKSGITEWAGNRPDVPHIGKSEVGGKVFPQKYNSSSYP
ncbi:hypothetical protein N1851_008191 [Merluccius polli]|uniref:Uncharacterized protein n=1 Tax=Merluccius polli TaxID=89951 RepID=A0AA47N1J4_MERPO|nr:hypothetical protein N1851_008191 [Merluccius polli]